MPINDSSSEGVAGATHFERQLRDRLEIRLAIAERDLRDARHRGAPNAVANAIEEVNRFRAQLGGVPEPGLPPHRADPSLRSPVRVLENGVRHYRFGFGLEVGQRVTWAHGSRPGLRRAGHVHEIFEYGREPKVTFQPDEGAGWWVAPGDLTPGAPAASQARPQAAVARGTAPLSDRLILMPCSAGKLDRPAPASKLYTGVMWQTLRSQMQLRPRLAILSAKHGILAEDEVVAPYEQLMTELRAQQLLSEVEHHATAARRALGDGPVNAVLLVGGKTYRRVMQRVVEQLQQDGVIGEHAQISSTVGGIGQQRSQLGAFLRAMPGSEQLYPA